MNYRNLQRELDLNKEQNFAVQMRCFSPIRKSRSEVNYVQSDKKYEENREIADNLVTRPNTSAKSFSSFPEYLNLIYLDDVEKLSKKVKEMEKKISENARLLKEQLEQNEKLASYVKMMENNEKESSKIFDTSSLNKFSCDKVCIAW